MPKESRFKAMHALSSPFRGGSFAAEPRKGFRGSLDAGVTDRFGMRWMPDQDLK
jgi:uncharacterized glyoxalase superfamily protein PhnB